MRSIGCVLLAIATALIAPSFVAAAPTIVAHRLVDRDQVGIAWWSAGRSRRGEPPVLFIHGGPGQGSQVFRATAMPLIGRSARVMTFDMRGAGASDAPTDTSLYNAAAVLTDIDAVLDAAGTRRAVLVAHSAGTIWALQYAERHPKRVAGLVLSGAVPDLPATLERLCERLEKEQPAVFERAVKAAGPGQRCMPFSGFASESAQKAWFDANMFPNEATHKLVNKLDKAAERHPGSLANTLLKDQMAFRVSRPERLTMPLLFLDGADDHQTDERSQQALAAKVRDGRYVAYPRAGHFPFADQPHRFARDVLALVRRLRKGG